MAHPQASYGIGGPAAAPPAAAVQVVPFDQASHRGYEPGPIFTVTPTTTSQTQGPTTIPANGYLRSILIEVSSAGGAGGSPVGAGDYPFNILSLIRLQDTNGAPIFELTAFNTLLCNIYGGYAGSPDPRNDPDYSANAANPAFQLRIPIEIAPTGLGALANQSASQAYKLTLTVDTIANIWTTAPSGTIPTLTIRTYTDYWTLPAAQDVLNRAQAQTPPYSGTAQYWRQSMNNSITTGNNNTKVTQVGNLIRTLIWVARVGGVRSETPWPDPWQLAWDQRILKNASAKTLRKEMREMVESLVARDTGTYAFNFSYGEGRHVGEVGINSWLPTVTATRLELDGSSAGSGTLDIITNDVSIAEINPQYRAVETSATGYHPTVSPELIGAQ